MARGIKALGGLGDGSFTMLEPQPSYGDVGAALISSGLSAYGQKKEKERTTKGLMDLGFSEQEAGALSKLPPQLMELFIKQLGARGYRGANFEQSQQGYAAPADEIVAAQESIPGKGQIEEIAAMLRQPEGMRVDPLKQLQMPQQSQQQAPALQQLQQSTQQAPRNIVERLQQPTRKEQREEEQLQLQKQNLEFKKEQAATKNELAAWKDSEKFRDKLYEKKEAAIADLEVLESMRDKVENGELDTPGYINMLEGYGLGNIGSLLKPGTQAFKKERQQFMKRLRPLFGGRITNLELEQFIQGIPDLMQSPEGQARLIAQFMKEAQINAAGWDLMWDIIDENKGQSPHDLQRQVDKRLEKVRDKAAEEFRENLKRPVPPPQNPLVTIGQSALGAAPRKLGSALRGGAGGALSGAVTGARLGGPSGALTGGLIGGGVGALGGLLS